MCMFHDYGLSSSQHGHGVGGLRAARDEAEVRLLQRAVAKKSTDETAFDERLCSWAISTVQVKAGLLELPEFPEFPCLFI